MASIAKGKDLNPNTQYRVELLKEQLTFSAAHFITFGSNICERLHGHNYGVRCSVVGSLNEHGYVVDFIALRDQLAGIAGELDHRVLLPEFHPTIKVTSGDEEVEATFENRRWVFPAEDCVILPIANTTAELIAKHFTERLMLDREAWCHAGVSAVTVGIDENQGQWGECLLELPPKT